MTAILNFHDALTPGEAETCSVEFGVPYNLHITFGISQICHPVLRYKYFRLMAAILNFHDESGYAPPSDKVEAWTIEFGVPENPLVAI